MRNAGQLAIVALLAFAGCSPPVGVPADKVMRDISVYMGRTIDLRASFRSGARCHLESEEWQTYCKGCQYCKGPLVVNLAGTSTTTDDWPMVLGGTYNYQDIRCKGPLDDVKCYPFEPGKTYVVRGFIEAYRPPRFMVQKFWDPTE